jgi:hypothetical protein
VTRMSDKLKVKIKNGDPLLPPIILGGVDYGSSSYQMRVDSAGAGIDGRWHTILKWSFPKKLIDGITRVPGGGNYGTHWPVFLLSLQRSFSADNMPYGEDNPFNISLSLTSRVTLGLPDWSTISTWPVTSVDRLPTTYTDGIQPTPTFNYRLIMQMGPFFIGSGAVAEIDWNVCTVSIH